MLSPIAKTNTETELGSDVSDDLNDLGSDASDDLNDGLVKKGLTYSQV